MNCGKRRKSGLVHCPPGTFSSLRRDAEQERFLLLKPGGGGPAGSVGTAVGHVMGKGVA